MIEDRDQLPQPHGRDPNDTRRRYLISPEPACTSHVRGRCTCEDDGSGALEWHPEDEIR